MVREIVHDPVVLARKSVEATAEDAPVAVDLIRGCGNSVRVGIVCCSLRGPAVHSFCCMHSRRKAKRRRKQNCAKRNVNIRTG